MFPARPGVSWWVVGLAGNPRETKIRRVEELLLQPASSCTDIIIPVSSDIIASNVKQSRYGYYGNHYVNINVYQHNWMLCEYRISCETRLSLKNSGSRRGIILSLVFLRQNICIFFQLWRYLNVWEDICQHSWKECSEKPDQLCSKALPI